MQPRASSLTYSREELLALQTNGQTDKTNNKQTNKRTGWDTTPNPSGAEEETQGLQGWS